ATLARSLVAPALVAEATERANREGIVTLSELVRDKLGANATVGVLGLSYKPNTDVVEESPGLLLVKELTDHGVDVIAYDPAAIPNARRAVRDTARFAQPAEECGRESDVGIVTTPWQEYTTHEPAALDRAGDARAVSDCWLA